MFIYLCICEVIEVSFEACKLGIFSGRDLIINKEQTKKLLKRMYFDILLFRFRNKRHGMGAFRISILSHVSQVSQGSLIVFNRVLIGVLKVLLLVL